jgi:hypothetical protein
MGGIVVLWTRPQTAAHKVKKEVKAVSVAGRGGLWGCEMLRIPHCLDNRLTDGSEVVSLIPPQKLYFSASDTYFC